MGGLEQFVGNKTTIRFLNNARSRLLCNKPVKKNLPEGGGGGKLKAGLRNRP